MGYAEEAARIDAHREERYAELIAAGVDLSNTYTDQEGCVWDMAYAQCPKCKAKSELSHRTMPSGYFNCPGCGLTYDEPNWEPCEVAFITNVDDED